MSLYHSVVKPFFFLFDPEKVHELVMGTLSKGLISTPAYHDSILEQTLFGTWFRNPIGLAAGFDKNAIALNHWHRLGFGFVEAGTITYHAQPGNPKPRLFRLPEDRALINRMGFNNEGAEAAAQRFASAKARIPVGINLGKSKITELVDAPKDYLESYRLLHTYGDYFVVNVSSPNTPGLRTLQEKGPLLEIIHAIRSIDPDKPLFVKVAPDLEFSALDDVIAVAHEANLTGLIATNTTIAREGLTFDPGETGGLSGAPVYQRSNQFLSYLYQSCNLDMILIGVGGIMSGEHVYEKIRLGANLTQIYTGWIYGGPKMIPAISKQLAFLMRRDGFDSIGQLRGTAHTK
jgi:dihydroorotate dehydrogenase